MTSNTHHAEQYFSKLNTLIMETQVTDRRGHTLSLDAGADKAIEFLLEIKASGRKVMLVGNGGTAAIVSHIQNDLCKAVGLRALVFNEPSLLTALANDHGYHTVFDRPLELWAEAGDLLIAISSSGKSESILRPVQTARARDCQIITFSGHRSDNPLRQLGDINFYTDSMEYGFVEVAHTSLTHYITDCACVK